MLSSMTGFGRREASDADFSWLWEIRSVNARGLELRWRLPPGFEALEPFLREAAARSVRRGNVQATLTVRPAGAVGAGINEALLDQLVQLALRAAAKVPGAAVPRVETLLGLPGVIAPNRQEITDITAEQMSALQGDFAGALEELVASRRAEGGRLGDILLGLIGQIEALRLDAEAAANLQPALHRERLVASVSALLAHVPALPEDRIAQEVALLVTKSDVREELDRLASHIQEARALLASGGAVGRQLDFLVQELLRETNTVCSKSASKELTSVGLKLKGVVEQVREQVQNLE
jgi:uncharacterized protein (TIGR00255 family)